mgnify:CR=1 FL=1
MDDSLWGINLESSSMLASLSLKHLSVGGHALRRCSLAADIPTLSSLPCMCVACCMPRVRDGLSKQRVLGREGLPPSPRLGQSLRFMACSIAAADDKISSNAGATPKIIAVVLA